MKQDAGDGTMTMERLDQAERSDALPTEETQRPDPMCKPRPLTNMGEMDDGIFV
jgi:hypothetical protein